MSEAQQLHQKLLVTGWTDGPSPIELTPYAEKPQWLQTALFCWRAIYMPHLGSAEVAGEDGSPIHIEEHLQTIQELSDHIFSP